MSRPSLNSNLTALARRAGELRFDDSTTAFSQFQNHKSSLMKSPRNCYAVPQGWAVKQYIGGSQRTLALFKPEFEYHATRFADLCIVHFWQYRKTTRAIADSDLNYSLQIAESALNSCTGAKSLLAQIERFLCQRFQINARPVTKTVQSLLPVYPIELTTADELIIKKWAEHDQLWTTRETVEFNLRSFARAILGMPARSPIFYQREIPDPEPATPVTPIPETPTITCAAKLCPNPNTVPVTTTGGDAGPATISPLFSK